MSAMGRLFTAACELVADYSIEEAAAILKRDYGITTEYALRVMREVYDEVMFSCEEFSGVDY